MTPIKVISDEEAAKTDYVVCMPSGRSGFKDNETGPCCACGQTIMWRPYMPKNVPKICVECAVKVVNSQ